MDKNLLHAVLLTLALVLTSCGPRPRQHSVSGTIEVDEARVASRYGGRVQKILAQEGDVLKDGQVIAELDAAELAAQRAQAAAQLSEMEAGPRPEELDEAKHDWEARVADSEQARADERRAEELFRQTTISVTEREQAVTRARTLEKNSAAARSRYELLLAGTRPERIAQARAAVAEIDTHLKEMRITSPSNAVLEVLNVKVGDVLGPNQEVATVLLPQHIWVRVYVPEPWLGHIQLGQTVQVGVDSSPGKAFAGVVEQIARAAEFTPRNVQTVGERIKQVFGVKVRLDNSQGDLRAGMAADVNFPTIAD